MTTPRSPGSRGPGQGQRGANRPNPGRPNPGRPNPGRPNPGRPLQAGRPQGGRSNFEGDSLESAPAPRRESGGREASGRESGGRAPRFQKPALAPQVTTLWEYPSQHYGDTQQGSQAYRGATPSHLIWNVIQRFTPEEGVVVDPFAGSGTTLDVCRDLGRTGLGFDLVVTREDVQQADARSLPLKQRSVDLVFMDPPYADNLDYSDDPRCIGKLPADGRWQRAMRLVIAEAHRVLREDGVLAVYVCDVFQKKRGFFPLGFEIFQMAAAKEFVPLDIVAVVRKNRTLEQGNYRKAADEGGFFLRGFNYLLLFRKSKAREAGRTAADSGESEF